MFKSRSRSLMAMACALALLSCVGAQAVPYHDSGPPRFEQARPAAQTKEVTAIAVPAAAIERADLSASPARHAARAVHRPAAEAVLVSILAAPGFTALAGAPRMSNAVAEARCWGENQRMSMNAFHSVPGIHADSEAEGRSPGNAIVVYA